MPTIDEIKVVVEAEVGKYNAKLDEALRRMDSFNQQINQKGKQNEQTFKNIGVAIAGAFTVDKLLDFTRAVVSTTAEFQKFEAVLTNTLGSNSAAQVALQQIQQFAAQTPFSVKETTDAFIRLANGGIKPTMSDMRSFADLAGNAGKSMTDLAEAVNDAQRGEFERLKEFFVDASVKGNKVEFTFKGIKTAVDNNAQSINAYLLSLGNLNGVAGASEKVMQTLGGQLNNLGDSWDKLLLAFGNAGEQVITKFISLTNNAITAYLDFIKTTGQKEQEQGLTRIGHNVELLDQRFQKFFDRTTKGGASTAEAIAQANKIIGASLEKDLTAALERATTAREKFQDANASAVGTRTNVGGITFTTGTAEAKAQAEALRLVAAARQSDVDVIRAQIAELSRLSAEAQKSIPPQLGLLEGLRAKLKEVETQRDKAPTEGEVAAAELRINSINKEIDRLEKLTEARTRVSVISISNQGRLTTGGIFESTADGLKQPMDKSLELMQQYRDRINNVQLIDPDKLVPKNRIDAVIERFKTLGQGGEREMSKMSEAINSALNGGVADALTNFADLVGNIAAGTVSGFENIFSSIMGIVADFLSQFGKALISAGVAAIAFDALIENPFAAVAAGVALVAAAAAVKGTLSKGLSGAGSAGASGGGGSSHRGGLSGGLSLNGEFVIRGQDLVYIVGKGQAKQHRMGG